VLARMKGGQEKPAKLKCLFPVEDAQLRSNWRMVERARRSTTMTTCHCGWGKLAILSALETWSCFDAQGGVEEGLRC
jgi:hypothetical protein